MPDTPRRLFWKTAAVLWGASLAGALLVLPYAMRLQADKLAQAAEKAQLPVWVLMAISIAQTSIYLVLLIAGGLWAAQKLELKTPLVTAWLTKEPRPPKTGATLLLALAIGGATGLVLIAADKWIFAPLPSVAGLLKAMEAPGTQPGRLYGLMASFYGAIDEEVLLRLGVMSLLALGLRAIARGLGVDRSQPLPSSVFWIANVLAAVLFGLGHLPATAAIAPLTTGLVVRAVVLNGLGGVVFGALYRRYGLEWGMAAHFGVDLVLHVATGG